MLVRSFITVLLALFVVPVFAASPDITVRDVDGNVKNVNEYIGKGKWTVVVFWAHDCHVCNQEIQQMTFFQDDHKDKDATVLGISMDGFEERKKSKAFIDRHELNFPNFLVELSQQEFMKFGGGRYVGTPTFYIYGREGKLLAKNIGPVDPESIEEFMRSN